MNFGGLASFKTACDSSLLIVCSFNRVNLAFQRAKDIVFWYLISSMCTKEASEARAA